MFERLTAFQLDLTCSTPAMYAVLYCAADFWLMLSSAAETVTFAAL